MKTIAVDEATWRKLKSLRDKLHAKSYDEVIRKLIEAWHLTEMSKLVSETTFSDDVRDRLMTYIVDRKRKVNE